MTRVLNVTHSRQETETACLPTCAQYNRPGTILLLDWKAHSL